MLQHYKHKSVQRSDLPKIVDLLAACEVIDQLETNRSLAELQRGFDNKPPNTIRNDYLWETPDGQAIGYGLYGIRHQPESQEAYPSVKVHPDYRKDNLEAEILTWCEQEIHKLCPNATIWVSARSDRTHYTTLYENQGYQPVRWFHRMSRSLRAPIPEPQLPAGFTTRTCQGDTDVEPWVEMFNQTFIDHWQFHPRPIENRRHEIQQPDYQADLDWIAVAPNGTFAAFCDAYIFHERNARTHRKEGWITGLGTRRGFRHQGLGRAMLLLGLQQLKATGMETALLDVDSENPNQAQKLYESMGFETIQTSVSYTKTL
ncbi:GNAT family N-acetyltransferase [Leptolyngbyaceae cyanobacterium CCMR0082]|uniref:GNAT family N-acetyltransferase n=1 Tax=Adonisia turfae CCMR0082 TaxID=2304604 RepID=A0A6M0S6V2_9CYAN|nr:GNAT family N-acetyltransferase [Adonisia turfae]NEZ64080.1 GNAT family N-acetyltransferase [Adonisia turfae CCMR0082]